MEIARQNSTKTISRLLKEKYNKAHPPFFKKIKYTKSKVGRLPVL